MMNARMFALELDEREKEGAKNEEMPLARIVGAKKGWAGAMARVSKDTGKVRVALSYDPCEWYGRRAPLSVSREGVVSFSTPNRDCPYDFYPSMESKIAGIAHELYGHGMDREYHYGRGAYVAGRFLSGWEAMLEEDLHYLSPEHRANLYAAFAYPVESFESAKEEIATGLKKNGFGRSALGRYLEPFACLEWLGSMGMPRKSDVIGFLADACKHSNAIAESFGAYHSVTGLAAPPRSGMDAGIRTRFEWSIACSAVRDYVSRPNPKNADRLGATLKSISYRTHSGPCNPLDSVDVRRLATSASRPKLERMSSYFERRASREDTFYEEYADAFVAMRRMVAVTTGVFIKGRTNNMEIVQHL